MGLLLQLQETFTETHHSRFVSSNLAWCSPLALPPWSASCVCRANVYNLPSPLQLQQALELSTWNRTAKQHFSGTLSTHHLNVHRSACLQQPLSSFPCKTASLASLHPGLGSLCTPRNTYRCLYHFFNASSAHSPMPSLSSSSTENFCLVSVTCHYSAASEGEQPVLFFCILFKLRNIYFRWSFKKQNKTKIVLPE